MNPELSLAATASLPRERANAKARRNVSSDVVTARTTSTSGISGTGLKKCRPTKRSARLVAAAMAAMVRLEVLEAKIEIGRASCRERVEISVVAVSLKKKKRKTGEGEMGSKERNKKLDGDEGDKKKSKTGYTRTGKSREKQ